MRQYLQHSPQIPSESQTRELLQDKIQHFSTIASELLADDSSTMQSITSNPRSPIANECTFFNEASSVVPMSVPPASPLSASAASPRFTQPTNLNQRAGQANSSLAKALDLDEAGHTKQAIESYMKAAELYLEAIKMSEEQPGDSSIGIIPVLKRRLGGALDRIEQIKTSSKDNTRATATIINSEKPKQAQQSQRQSLHYTKEEIDVLKRSSMLTTGVFLPWSDAEAEDLSRRVRTIGNQGTILFTDSERIKLNDKQRKKFFKWARPAHILAQRQVSSQSPVLIRTITPYSIRQKCVTDCSFIASLCICADFERRFRKRLITSIIYPQDKNGIPCYNPEGKYMVKLWLNGVPRQVIVDDFLPIDRHGNLLCSHTTGNRLELWVPIIEKAYMKLCGGYDFPGSNSGVDMFSLTGWIPERIFFAQDSSKIKDYETSPERAWERLFSANSFGDCLITVSTTKDLAEDRAEELGLVTGHAYSVLDVIQTRGGIRLLQLKNPWAHKGWKGRYSCYDRSTWHSALRKEVGYDPELAAKCDDGVFWIEWRDVLLYFRNLQLSWNPDLFSHTYRTHSFWPRQQGPDDDTFNIGENPQFIVHLSREALLKRATLWILISRHVTKQEQEGVEVSRYAVLGVVYLDKLCNEESSDEPDTLFRPRIS
jgi:calpain-7